MKNQPFWQRYGAWVLACAAGEAVGLTASASISAAIGTAEYTEPWFHRTIMIGAGALEGLCLGALQFVALRRWLPVRFGPWIFASAVGMALGWLLGSSFPVPVQDEFAPSTGITLVYGLTMGLALGAVLGAAQALVLRRMAPIRMFIVANGMGWAAGMVVQFVGASQLAAGAWQWEMIFLGLATGAAVGATVGAVTGLPVTEWGSESEPAGPKLGG